MPRDEGEHAKRALLELFVLSQRFLRDYLMATANAADPDRRP